jgi:four helix bundle protein
MKNFRELRIWQRGHQLTLNIYHTTKQFPKEEMYGLINQMRRSSSSIPTNIAEGCGRDSEADLGRFLTIALGSASELEYQLILANDLAYIDMTTYVELITEVVEIKKMLSAFLLKLKANR